MQVIEFARRLDAKTAAERLNLQNSLLISLLAGNLTVETGSIATASATIKILHTCTDATFSVGHVALTAAGRLL